MKKRTSKAWAAFCCMALFAAFRSVAASSLQAAEKNLPIHGELFTIEDRTAFLILPEKTKSGGPIPWVWYAPTLKGLPGKHEKWMFEQFVNNGIAIAGVDVGESYGSPKGRAVYSALYKELLKKQGLAKKASLLARSRGGLMLYNWAAENPESVACIAGIYPVCGLSSYPGLIRAGTCSTGTAPKASTQSASTTGNSFSTATTPNSRNQAQDRHCSTSPMIPPKPQTSAQATPK